jgi:hypothetical protein
VVGLLVCTDLCSCGLGDEVCLGCRGDLVGSGGPTLLCGGVRGLVEGPGLGGLGDALLGCNCRHMMGGAPMGTPSIIFICGGIGNP